MARTQSSRLLPAFSLALILGLALPASGGFSVDEVPAEVVIDPGDVWLPGLVCEVDDGDLSCGPTVIPSLNLPAVEAANFDLDGVALEEPLEVCPPGATHTAGLLISLDDGDPGPGVGPPDNATEIFFYDHCRALAATRRTYLTSITESALGLGLDPGVTARDDDVDAYETREFLGPWQAGIPIVFSADAPSNGGLVPGNMYVAYPDGSQLVWATPQSLGVPDPDDCDIDGLAPIADENDNWHVLFTTDRLAPCGLDPGDIYVSNNFTPPNSQYWLYADDVVDLKIAAVEGQDVDVDAIAINSVEGSFQIGDPYEPPPSDDDTFYKADWPNHAPSGMPDFSQDQWAATPNWCGPSAVADSLWWFDSELECDRDRTTGQATETESNDLCDLADALGEVPPVTGGLASGLDVDWYEFSIPYGMRDKLCTVTVSTCALGTPADADTYLRLYGECDAASSTPGQLIAENDDGCVGAFRQQSEITVDLGPGKSYWVEVSKGPLGPGADYTLSLGIDCYPLVQRYVESPDDHAVKNVRYLLPDLADCMNTDDQKGTGSGHLGTKLDEMDACIATWLTDAGLDTDFTKLKLLVPDFEDVEDEVERSEDVVLLLGFYWFDGVGWVRCGGHYVTAAGVDGDNLTITLSDPALNNAEFGGAGRVRGPDHGNHAGTVTPPPSHDDAENVSHDRYPAGIPGATAFAAWRIPTYATSGLETLCTDVARWCTGPEAGQNPPSSDPPQAPCPDPQVVISTEVEAMIAVSPVQHPVCVYLTPDDVWPDNLRVRRGLCAPASLNENYDVIRGKTCNLRFSTTVSEVDLGHVICLYDDANFEEWDDLSPDDTGCFGAWFYLARRDDGTNPDYGKAVPGLEPRYPSSGACP